MENKKTNHRKKLMEDCPFGNELVCRYLELLGRRKISKELMPEMDNMFFTFLEHLRNGDDPEFDCNDLIRKSL